MPESELSPKRLGSGCGGVAAKIAIIVLSFWLLAKLPRTIDRLMLYQKTTSSQWLKWIIGTIPFLLVILIVGLGLIRIYIFKKTAPERAEKKMKQEEARRLYEDERRENKQYLIAFIQQNFLVQPCFSCHEFTMRLLEISPNTRSILYQCIHCEKKMRAAAGTPEAAQLGDIWRAYCDRYYDKNLVFETVPAPMPYEQTTRTPLPEAVRAEVWRRDQGRCVNCGSKENLHFDHIIPVSRGGSTSAKNLQLLCQSCNLAKGAKI